MKQIRCPGCGVTMHYMPHHEGQSFQCPQCAASIAIPRPAPPTPPAPAQAAATPPLPTQPTPLRSATPAPASPPAANPFAAASIKNAASASFGRRDAVAPAAPAASSASEPNPADSDEPPYDVVESLPELPDEQRNPWTPPRPRPPVRDDVNAGHNLFLDFSFENFVTPLLIRLLWVLAVVFAVLFGALVLFTAIVKPHNGSLYEPTIFTYLGAFVALFVSLVGYRIICEAAIVFFDIRDTLRRMERRLADTATRRD